jgi:hypothetical protein
VIPGYGHFPGADLDDPEVVERDRRRSPHAAGRPVGDEMGEAGDDDPPRVRYGEKAADRVRGEFEGLGRIVGADNPT